MRSVSPAYGGDEIRKSPCAADPRPRTRRASDRPEGPSPSVVLRAGIRTFTVARQRRNSTGLPLRSAPNEGSSKASPRHDSAASKRSLKCVPYGKGLHIDCQGPVGKNPLLRSNEPGTQRRPAESVVCYAVFVQRRRQQRLREWHGNGTQSQLSPADTESGCGSDREKPL